MERIGTANEQKLDRVKRSPTKAERKLVKFMTKVIRGTTDELGGCRNAHPDVPEGLAGR
jgi:hypothetical protein